MGATQYSFNIFTTYAWICSMSLLYKQWGAFIRSPETWPRHVDRTMFNKIIAKELAALIEVVQVSIYFAWYVGMCRREYCKKEHVKPFLILVRDWHFLIGVSYSERGGENISWWCTNIRCSSHFLCFCAKIVVSWGRGCEEGWGCDKWGQGLIIT